MEIKTICVCGAGTMGSGIAQVSASSGFQTILYELDKEVLLKAQSSIEKNLQTLIEKGKLEPGQKKSVTDRILYTSEIDSCRADLFIEAIVEKPQIKISLFNQLAELNSDETIFATNTSSLSVTGIAKEIKNPSRVLGLHFFNPAPIMKLVEIVATPYTSEQFIEIIRRLSVQMGKTPVLCKDSPGFIVNRVARPYYIESLRLAESGIADFTQLDALLESSGFRMGPFKLMDLIGNDINYAVSCSVYEQLGTPARLKPSSIQEQKVKEGKLGRKTGEGYYRYD